MRKPIGWRVLGDRPLAVLWDEDEDVDEDEDEDEDAEVGEERREVLATLLELEEPISIG